MLNGWNFQYIDAIGHLGGLVVGCINLSFNLINSWRTLLGLGVELFSEGLSLPFTMLNVNDPSLNQRFFGSIFSTTPWSICLI